MRRPVKPFVTEYRGGTRRQGAGGQAPKPDFSNIDPDPPAEQRPALTNLADPQEDSYEAALRAADALFSTRQRDAAPAAQPPSDAPVDGSTPSAQAAPSGGRVLRVLDEPPSPELLRLEAERAPKRRGRKPGSKNKPKPVPAFVAQDAIEAPTDTPAMESAEPKPMLAVARLAALPRGPARGPAIAAAQVGDRISGDKYAWVRTKLKPGQQWKRRLPKVAW